MRPLERRLSSCAVHPVRVFSPRPLGRNCACSDRVAGDAQTARMGAERPDSSAGGAGGRADAAPSTKAQSGGLAQRLLSSARRQQEALVGTISSLLRGCSSRSHKPSREPKLSAAASARSEPSRDSTRSETGAVATLAAFGHGGQSHEVPPCPATSQGACPHLAFPHHAHLRLAGHVLFQAQARRRPRRERAAHARAVHGQGLGLGLGLGLTLTLTSSP